MTTTQELITSIELRSFAPIDQNTFSPEKLLLLAHEQLQSVILPEILSVREEYFVTYVDYPIIVGKQSYPVPSRAIGMSLREVKIIQGNNVINVTQMTPEAISSTSSGDPTSFYMQDNNLILYPRPATTKDILRVYYCKRPSKLCLTSDAAIISAIDTVSKTVTVSSVPASWSTSTQLDLIRQDGSHENLAIDQSITSLSDTEIVFANELPESLQVGDWVSIRNTSPLVQLPEEYITVLSQATCCRVVQSMRLPGLDGEMQTLQSMMEMSKKLISPRVTGETKKITVKNWF